MSIHVFRMSSLLVSFVVLLASCQRAPGEESPPADEVEGSASLVEGWSCQSPASCFGFQVGRVRTFERRVGERVEREVWTMMDQVSVDGGTRYVQSGGPEVYELREDGLYMPFRGELLLAVPFGSEGLLDTPLASVATTLRALDGPWSSPAGTFERCIEHSARFLNEEMPSRDGLVVETLFCEGVGEVAQTIRIPEMPFPVSITLVELPMPGSKEVRTAYAMASETVH